MNQKIFLPIAVFLLALGISWHLGSGRDQDSVEIDSDPHPFPEILNWSWKSFSGDNVPFSREENGYSLVFMGNLEESQNREFMLQIFSNLSNQKWDAPISGIFLSDNPEKDAVRYTEMLTKSQNLNLERAGFGYIEDPDKRKKWNSLMGVKDPETDPIPIQKNTPGMESGTWFFLLSPDLRILAAYPIQIRWERLIMEIGAHIKHQRKS
jgi:hypothetical protein